MMKQWRRVRMATALGGALLLWAGAASAHDGVCPGGTRTVIETPWHAEQVRREVVPAGSDWGRWRLLVFAKNTGPHTTLFGTRVGLCRLRASLFQGQTVRAACPLLGEQNLFTQITRQFPTEGVTVKFAVCRELGG